MVDLSGTKHWLADIGCAPPLAALIVMSGLLISLATCDGPAERRYRAESAPIEVDWSDASATTIVIDVKRSDPAPASTAPVSTTPASTTPASTTPASTTPASTTRPTTAAVPPTRPTTGTATTGAPPVTGESTVPSTPAPAAGTAAPPPAADPEAPTTAPATTAPATTAPAAPTTTAPAPPPSGFTASLACLPNARLRVSGTDTPGGQVAVYAPTATARITAGSDGRYATVVNDTDQVGRPYGIDVVSMTANQMLRLEVTCPQS